MAKPVVVVPTHHHLRTAVISGALLVAVVWFLATNRQDFSGTLLLLRRAPSDLLLMGCGLVAGTYVAAALSYLFLAADRRISLLRTLLVQVASGIVNRLLPAGLGGAGLYTLYLKRCGFAYSQATALVAANNILGAVGNALLLTVVLILAPPSQIVSNFDPSTALLAAAAVLLLAAIIFAGFRQSGWVQKSVTFVNDMLRNLRHALVPSGRTAASLASNMALTSMNGLILCLAVAAAGGAMYWPLSIVVMSAGALLGAVVPTPGGLGGVEAGILAGLVACGVPAAAALAATVMYRGLTYWLPIIPGLLLLPHVKKRYLP